MHSNVIYNIVFFGGGGADIILCLLRNFVFFWFHFDSVL